MHPDNSFVTLTYTPEHLPDDLSLDLRHWQLFMKRLRERVGSKVRYFACGEYSDTNFRPHYHALIFNYWPKDATFLKKTERGDHLYKSSFLDEVWGLGHTFTGRVTYQSAGYVARYVMKKQNGDFADRRYSRVDPEGRTYLVKPEFAVMSRNPGLGAEWFDKFKSDAFPSDFIVIEGQKLPVPRFYTDKLQEDAAQKIKRIRKQKALKHRVDQTPSRLQQRETVLNARIKMLKREI